MKRKTRAEKLLDLCSAWLCEEVTDAEEKLREVCVGRFSDFTFTGDILFLAFCAGHAAGKKEAMRGKGD
jgi:hypothetical protein